jgi:hypothetical protein
VREEQSYHYLLCVLAELFVTLTEFAVSVVTNGSTLLAEVSVVLAIFADVAVEELVAGGFFNFFLDRLFFGLAQRGASNK